MRQVLSRKVLGKGVLTAAAASSLLSIATGAAYAHTGAGAEAAHSPGVLAGNSVSVPITFSPNVCGNSVDAGAGLNPAMGGTCVTTDGGGHADHSDRAEYERYLSPEHAAAFERYLDEREHGAVHEPRREPERHDERAGSGRHRMPDQRGQEHGQDRHEGAHQGGYGDGPDEDCDEHPRATPPPAAHHAPPAPRPAHAKPKPVPAPHAAPPAHHAAPAPKPKPAPVHHAAPAPKPKPAPVHHEAPEPRPQQHGSQFGEHPAAPAPAPAPAAAPAPPAPPPPSPPAPACPPNSATSPGAAP
ncbi:chaplin, partial [Streptomyces sp. NPDC059917]|uniref:chaplin n=1 Tax=Streptomyces sp. NPDC059917 TaxID=3347002 RepID=UPI0036553E34